MERYGADYSGRYGGRYARGRGRRREMGPPARMGYDGPFGHGWKPGYDLHPSTRYGGQEMRGRDSRGGYGYDYGRAGNVSSFGGPGRWLPSSYATGGDDADTVRAADIMTRNPEAVTPDTPVLEVARRMRDLDVGVMPIVDQVDSFRLQGIVTDRDIAIRAAAEGKDMKKTSVREIMSPKPETVAEGAHVRDVFAVMKRARVRRVPVTDAEGRLVGIIAQADLAVNYAGLDLQRETEVEEVIERISEPARPRWGRDDVPFDPHGRAEHRFRPALDGGLPDRVRAGWRTLRREARELIGRGYDRGWR
jgi:CBS domain-containing protein